MHWWYLRLELGGFIKLSIFKQIDKIPKSKEDKSKYAKYSTSPTTVEVNSETEILDYILFYGWSPNIFKTSRLKDDFISSDFLVLDIDSGLRIEEAKSMVEEADIACLCVTTTSHTEENHRYRLIFPTSRTITSKDDYEASINDLFEAFPMADKSCRDEARFYFQGTMEKYFWHEGSLIEPIKVVKQPIKQVGKRPSSESSIRVAEDLAETVKELYGESRDKIPEAVDFFLKEAPSGLEGSWTVSLNNFCFVLSLQCVEFDVVYDIVEYLAPEALDKTDIATINKAYADGERFRDD